MEISISLQSITRVASSCSLGANFTTLFKLLVCSETQDKEERMEGGGWFLVAIQEFNLGPSIIELNQYMILLTLQEFYNHGDSKSVSSQLFIEFQ